MCFKNPLYQVLCLVITVILYRGATAECDPKSMEAVISYKLEKLQQCMIEKVKQEKTDASEFHHDSFSNETSVRNIMEKIEQKIMRKLATHFEQHSTYVIEKLAALTTNVQQMMEQKHANEKEFQKFQNSTKAQLEEVMVKLAALTTNDQQMADSNQNLRNITDKIVVSLSGVEKQLTNIKEVSYETSTRLDPPSCATLNINETGTYSIRPAGVVQPFLVLCDFENNFNLGGGWTVFQRRIDGAVDFYQNWTMYKNGFGDVNGEHWLGLEKLHLMTRSGRHELLVVLEDYEANAAYALYDSFQIGSEAEKYKLTIGKYSGTASDSLAWHNGMKFSTFDQDNDTSKDLNCAQYVHGAWWFIHCAHCHLNEKYRKKGEHLNVNWNGLIWYHWKGSSYSLKSTKMMFRRRSG